MNRILSQASETIGPPLQGIGTYGTGGASSPSNFTRILTVVIGIMTLVAGIWFIFLLISGGIAWMSSGGDKGKLAAARSSMVSGAIGLTIVVIALFLTEIFGGMIGLDSILDPAGMILNISP